MSIIDSFDPERRSSINFEDVYEKSDKTLSVCIINFSYKIMDALIENGVLEEFAPDTVKSVACVYPIYRVKGTEIGVVKTTVGAPMAAGLLEEIGYIFSCRKFVMFGSCGSLDKSITEGRLIVPTAAYRDEGMSYHYLPPADYVTLPNAKHVEAILRSLGIDCAVGKTWTTDAFYRETVRNRERRRAEGCIAVEMEVAACQAVATYREIEFFCFLYRADNLDATTWERGFLSRLPLDVRLQNFYVALEVAKRVIGDLL